MFIEKDASKAVELERRIADTFPSAKVDVKVGDANEHLSRWAAGLTHKDRAVVFLDPFGLQIDWCTIETLAATKKVDLWVLVPTSAVLRMMPVADLPRSEWQMRLTRFFGTDEWRSHFYEAGRDDQPLLDLGVEPKGRTHQKEENVARYFIHRLESVFSGVLKDPIPLGSDKAGILFRLCFATGNPRGKDIALKIAGHLAKKMLSIV